MDSEAGLQVPEGSGEQGKLETAGWKITCGAPMTYMVKGLMMIIMMIIMMKMAPGFFFNFLHIH